MAAEAPAQNVNAYLRTKVLTATPEELRMMLLDGAVKFARQGREGLAKKDYEATYNGFSRCRNILVELMSSVRPDTDPTLVGRINALYTFIYTELTQASMEKDVPRADKAIELIEFERETWAMAMQKLANERAGGANPDGSGSPGSHAERAPLSLQG